MEDGKTACPYCGKRFKKVGSHVAHTHEKHRSVEVRKDGEVWYARRLRHAVPDEEGWKVGRLDDGYVMWEWADGWRWWCLDKKWKVGQRINKIRSSGIIRDGRLAGQRWGYGGNLHPAYMNDGSNESGWFVFVA